MDSFLVVLLTIFVIHFTFSILLASICLIAVFTFWLCQLLTCKDPITCEYYFPSQNVLDSFFIGSQKFDEKDKLVDLTESEMKSLQSKHNMRIFKRIMALYCGATAVFMVLIISTAFGFGLLCILGIFIAIAISFLIRYIEKKRKKVIVNISNENKQLFVYEENKSDKKDGNINSENKRENKEYYNKPVIFLVKKFNDNELIFVRTRKRGSKVLKIWDYKKNETVHEIVLDKYFRFGKRRGVRRSVETIENIKRKFSVEILSSTKISVASMYKFHDFCLVYCTKRKKVVRKMPSSVVRRLSNDCFAIISSKKDIVVIELVDTKSVLKFQELRIKVFGYFTFKRLSEREFIILYLEGNEKKSDNLSVDNEDFVVVSEEQKNNNEKTTSTRGGVNVPKEIEIVVKRYKLNNSKEYELMDLRKVKKKRNLNGKVKRGLEEVNKEEIFIEEKVVKDINKKVSFQFECDFERRKSVTSYNINWVRVVQKTHFIDGILNWDDISSWFGCELLSHKHLFFKLEGRWFIFDIRNKKAKVLSFFRFEKENKKNQMINFAETRYCTGREIQKISSTKICVLEKNSIQLWGERYSRWTVFLYDMISDSFEKPLYNETIRPDLLVLSSKHYVSLSKDEKNFFFRIRNIQDTSKQTIIDFGASVFSEKRFKPISWYRSVSNFIPLNVHSFIYIDNHTLPYEVSLIEIDTITKIKKVLYRGATVNKNEDLIYCKLNCGKIALVFNGYKIVIWRLKNHSKLKYLLAFIFNKLNIPQDILRFIIIPFLL